MEDGRPEASANAPSSFETAPPAPDQAQGGLQPRPASANWQTCSGWLAGHTSLVLHLGNRALLRIGLSMACGFWVAMVAYFVESKADMADQRGPSG